MIMAPNITHYISVFSMLICFSFLSHSQVGINTDNPAPGALLDMNASDKGFLMTRVALVATDNQTPITPSPTTGLLVYNTATSGSGSTQVTPGFYYWDGTAWRRLFNQGYTLQYKQTAARTVTTTGNTVITGLDTGNGFTVPFSGIYQVVIQVYYSCGAQSGTDDAASQGSIGLWYNENGGGFQIPKEAYITSSSKYIGGTTFNHLGNQATIVHNLELSASSSYRIVAVGREWLSVNTTERPVIGRQTNVTDYPGSSTDDAQLGTMTISLIKQY